MLRSAASKVAWAGRAPVFLVGLAVILALVLGVATTAVGANGSPFLLGKRNAASAVSTLVRQGPALNLVVGAGQAPLTVHSDARVTDLNADKVDGREASSFADGVDGLATNAQQLDGRDSTDFANTSHDHHGAFYASGTKVRDSDLLDGSNSTDFAPAYKRTVLVSPVGTATQNGSALKNALGSITDAT